MSRRLRVGATLVITGLAVAYLLWKIDVSKTLRILAHAHLGWFLPPLAIMAGGGWALAGRPKYRLPGEGLSRPSPCATCAPFSAPSARPGLPPGVGRDAT